MKKKTCCTLVCCLLLSSCSDSSSDNKETLLFNDYSYFPYDLKTFDDEYLLDSQLRELSALSFYDDDNLLCLNDEEGLVFKYNLLKHEITNEYKFADDGDYEGIEYVNGILYVLRSDSKIFEIKNFDSNNIQVSSYSGFLSAKNDTEGLAYDPKTDCLLIACKDKPSYKKHKLRKKRAVYSFDIANNKYLAEPTYLVDLDIIGNEILSSSEEKIPQGYIDRMIDKKDLFVFHPSAIAVHPISDNIYMLSSVAKLLIVISPDNILLSISLLNKEIMPKPEGICFSHNGDMYISSEGKSERASIHKYIYKLK